MVDANGNATAFKYDVHGREIERRNAAGDTWAFAYDSRDNMVLTADAKGQRIEKTYDAMNRLTRMIMLRADGTLEDDLNFGYDAMGQRTAAWDYDSSLAWTYDGASRIQTVAVHDGPTNVQPASVLTHAYNAVGDRMSLSDSLGGVSWFDHDVEGRLTRVTTVAGDTIDLAYDAAGRLTRIANPNAVETLLLYDSTTGQPGSITTSRGATHLLPLDYGFDLDGKITSITDNVGTRNFTYDALQQVTGGGYASAPESYAYDPEGNRTASHLSATYKHDTANRLRESADACYDYDANGNLVSRTARVGALCNGGVTAYEWDVLNRLVRIDFADATYAAYRYDAVGRRIAKDVDGTETRYVYDGSDISLEFDGTNILTARYSHGEEVDQPLAMTRGGQSYFYGVDHLGSVRLLTDAAGAMTNRYDYDSFGNLETTSYESVINPYAFTARERDAESGLMFYRARYYDPEIGRFISEDPIGFNARDMNVYRYTSNGPVNLSDPTGLMESGGDKIPAGAASGEVGAVGTRLGCTFSNLAGLVELATSMTGGDAVGVITSVSDLGSCTGSQVTLLMRGPGNKLVEFGGFIARPFNQLYKNAKDPRLKSIIKKLFNDGNGGYGSGSATDTRVWEKINNVFLRKDQHFQKLWDEMNRLNKVLADKHVGLPDKATAEMLLKDIMDTLNKW